MIIKYIICISVSRILSITFIKFSLSSITIDPDPLFKWYAYSKDYYDYFIINEEEWLGDQEHFL